MTQTQKDERFYGLVDQFIEDYQISEQAAERLAKDELGYIAKWSRQGDYSF